MSDQDKLLEIVLSSSDWPVEQAAFAKLTDPQVLAKLVVNDERSHWASDAVEKINDIAVLEDLALEDVSSNLQVSIHGRLVNQIGKISDQRVLELLTRSSSISRESNLKVVEHIKDKELLLKLAMEEPSDWIGRAVVAKLSSQERLLKVARGGPNSDIRARAAKKLTDPQDLLEVINGENDRFTKAAAASQLTDVSTLLTILKSPDGHEEMKNSASSRIIELLPERLEDLRLVLGEPIRGSGFLSDFNSLLESGIQASVDKETLAAIIKSPNASTAARAEAAARLENWQLLSDLLKIADGHYAKYLGLLSTLKDDEMLLEIARSGRNSRLRIEAMARLSDPLLLDAILASEPRDSDVSKAAKKRVDALLAELAVRDDQMKLAQIALSEATKDLRWKALVALTDQRALKRIAVGDPNSVFRSQATGQLSDQDLLEDIAASDPHQHVRWSAAARLLAGQQHPDNQRVDMQRIYAIMLEKGVRDHFGLLSFKRGESWRNIEYVDRFSKLPVATLRIQTVVLKFFTPSSEEVFSEKFEAPYAAIEEFGGGGKDREATIDINKICRRLLSPLNAGELEDVFAETRQCLQQQVAQ